MTSSPELIHELRASRPSAPPSCGRVSARSPRSSPRARRWASCRFPVRRGVLVAIPAAAALAFASAGVLGLARSDVSREASAQESLDSATALGQDRRAGAEHRRRDSATAGPAVGPHGRSRAARERDADGRGRGLRRRLARGAGRTRPDPHARRLRRQRRRSRRARRGARRSPSASRSRRCRRRSRASPGSAASSRSRSRSTTCRRRSTSSSGARRPCGARSRASAPGSRPESLDAADRSGARARGCRRSAASCRVAHGHLRRPKPRRGCRRSSSPS